MTHFRPTGAFLCITLAAALASAAPATRPTTRPASPAASGLTADASPAGAADYVELAEAYVEANPAAPDAGAALMDALTVAVAAKDAVATEQLQRRILWDSPDGVQAAYLLKTNKAEALKDIYDSLIPDDWFEPSAAYLAKFRAAMRRPAAVYGSDLLKADYFSLQAALLLRQAGDEATAESVRKRFEASDGSSLTRQAGLVLLAADATPAEKLEQLKAFVDRDGIAPYELYLICRLPAEARRTLPVLRREADLRVAMTPPAEALAAQDRLTAAGEPVDARRSYLRGYLTASAGDAAKAAALLRATAAEYPNDPWGGAAGEFAPIVAVMDASEAQQVDAAEALFDHLVRRLGQVELAAHLKVNGTPAEAYFSLSAEGQVNLTVTSGGKTAFAYRTNGSAGEVYAQGAAEAVEFGQGAYFPVPTASLSDWPNGKSVFRLGFSLKGTLEEARREMANSPIVQAGRPALRNGIARSRRRGWFSAPTEHKGGVTTYVWVRPPTRPEEAMEMGRYAVAVDAKDVLTFTYGTDESAKEKNGFTLDFKAGPAGSFALSPPAWPDVPTVKRDKLEPAALLQMLAKVAAALKPALEKAGS